MMDRRHEMRKRGGERESVFGRPRVVAGSGTGVIKPYRGMPSIPVLARPVEAPTSRFDSRGCPFHRHPRPRAEEAGRTSATRLLQLAGVERLPRAMNEIWYQGSETPGSGRRATRVVGQAARGALEHASAPPSSSTLCALRAQAIDAAQGQPGREGRRWHPLCQLEEELG
jgi:hypothetical protein